MQNQSEKTSKTRQKFDLGKEQKITELSIEFGAL